MASSLHLFIRRALAPAQEALLNTTTAATTSQAARAEAGAPVTSGGVPDARSGTRRWRMLPPAVDPVDPHAVARAALVGRPLDRVLEEVRARLAHRYDARGALLTASGTQALTVALRAAIRDRDDPGVALPAWGCYALVSAVVGAGARAHFYDLDPRTLAPDPASLGEALDAGARTVVSVHLYGYPGITDGLMERIDEAGALLVEDAAQGAGGTYGDRLLGSLGDLTVLSFGRGKGLTCGGGGALLWRGEAGERAASLHGWGHGGGVSGGRGPGAPARGRTSGWRELALTAAQWALGRPELYRIPASLPFLGLGETTYEPPVEPGPIPERVARLLAESLRDRGTGPLRARRANASRLERLLEEPAAARLIRPVPGGDPGCLRLPVLLEEGAEAPHLGILRAYPRLLPQLDAAPHVDGEPHRPLPGAETLRDRLRTLPVHPRLREDDLRAVACWVHEALGERPPTTIANSQEESSVTEDSGSDA